MELIEFIEALKDISKVADNPNIIEVRMADYAPVVKPIYKSNIVLGIVKFLPPNLINNSSVL